MPNNCSQKELHFWNAKKKYIKLNNVSYTHIPVLWLYGQSNHKTFFFFFFTISHLFIIWNMLCFIWCNYCQARKTSKRNMGQSLYVVHFPHASSLSYALKCVIMPSIYISFFFFSLFLNVIKKCYFYTGVTYPCFVTWCNL